MSQYPPNFSYVVADKAVDLDSLDLVRVHRKSLRTLILKRRGLV